MSVSILESAGAANDLKKAGNRRPVAGATGSDRLPPHSHEAEQGVIGCILLSPNECLGQCIEKLKAGAQTFYDIRHGIIYTALVDMYDRCEPIDIITLQQLLSDRQAGQGNSLLTQIGGIPYLNALQDSVPSAANLGYYLDIVEEKFLLRKMIRTCTDLIGRVYDYDGDVDSLLDEVERDILSLSESRAEGGVVPVKTLVHKAIGTVENYFNRQGAISGLPTGFSDLDRMTDGLHGGEMIVIAARPSIGKTSIALNIAEHVAMNAVWVEETDDEALAMEARAKGLRVEEIQ